MRQAYGIDASKSKERKTNCKNRRDKSACLGPLFIGDRGLVVRNCTECGDTGELRSYWENDIYKIVNCKGENSLVYEVQPGKYQDGKKRRVLHRNMLPCEAILEEPEGFHWEKEKQKKPKQQLVTSLSIIPVTQKAVRMSCKG